MKSSKIKGGKNAMANEVIAITDGFYTLQETEYEKKFRFFRNDGNELVNVGKEPMEMYREYVIHKMRDTETHDLFFSNLQTEMSADRRYIKLTIYKKGESIPIKESRFKKHSNFIRRLFHKKE